MATTTKIKRWACGSCQAKQLTIVWLDNKLIMTCDTCGHGQWVKRG
jgi:ribosomal protein S27AE